MEYRTTLHEYQYDDAPGVYCYGFFTFNYLARDVANTVLDIFKYGDTLLDNNQVERLNRYISISRRNSLFFGSHKGAERGAILYTNLFF